MCDNDATAGDSAEEGRLGDREAVTFASAAADDSPCRATIAGGRLNNILPSLASSDQAALGIRGMSVRTGATLFMFERCVERLLLNQ
jgi:hypothetical protein